VDLSRRRILAAGSALVVSARVAAQAQSPSSDAAPNPEQMQQDQRGGLYANLRDPNITQLPADAFAREPLRPL